LTDGTLDLKKISMHLLTAMANKIGRKGKDGKEDADGDAAADDDDLLGIVYVVVARSKGIVNALIAVIRDKVACKNKLMSALTIAATRSSADE